MEQHGTTIRSQDHVRTRLKVEKLEMRLLHLQPVLELARGKNLAHPSPEGPSYAEVDHGQDRPACSVARGLRSLCRQPPLIQGSELRETRCAPQRIVLAHLVPSRARGELAPARQEPSQTTALKSLQRTPQLAQSACRGVPARQIAFVQHRRLSAQGAL